MFELPGHRSLRVLGRREEIVSTTADQPPPRTKLTSRSAVAFHGQHTYRIAACNNDGTNRKTLIVMDQHKTCDPIQRAHRAELIVDYEVPEYRRTHWRMQFLLRDLFAPAVARVPRTKGVPISDALKDDFVVSSGMAGSRPEPAAKKDGEGVARLAG